MDLAYFIQRLKNNTLQNIGWDYFDDIDWVYHINTSLIFFYNYMNSNWLWYYSHVHETLTSQTESTIWATNDVISRIFKVYDKSNKIELRQNNISPTMKWDGRWLFSMTGSKQITSGQGTTEIEIWYQRLPIWHDFTNLSQQIDLPREAIGSLEFLILRRIMPIHLEQGATLANNYFEQAKASMDIYAANIWYTNSMKGMVSSDQFNNEQSMQTRWKSFN